MIGLLNSNSSESVSLSSEYISDTYSITARKYGKTVVFSGLICFDNTGWSSPIKIGTLPDNYIPNDTYRTICTSMQPNWDYPGNACFEGGILLTLIYNGDIYIAGDLKSNTAVWFDICYLTK